MAKFVATDYKVMINGTDYSGNIAAVTMDISTDEVETTSFGKTFRTRLAGLRDTSVKIQNVKHISCQDINQRNKDYVRRTSLIDIPALQILSYNYFLLKCYTIISVQSSAHFIF